MSKLYVVIPGFGKPHLQEKIAIFENNMRVLSSYPYEWYLTVCIYDEDLSIREKLQSIVMSYLPETHICFIQEKGIVGQFIKKYASPQQLLNNSIQYVMLLLDDVELIASSWSWNKLIYDYNQQGYDLCSPTMTHDSKYLFSYMLTKHVWNERNIDAIFITSACEFFCYFMNLKTYVRYYNEIQETHPWMWGIDLVLTKHLHLKVAMLNYLQMKHYFQNTSTYSESTLEVFEKMREYLDKYKETQESLALQPAILEERLIYNRTSKT